MSTSEYWTRFTFVLLMGNKNIQIDQLLLKETADLTDSDKLHLMIAKATFLSTIGERTIEAMQNQCPKDKILEKDLKWIKAKWEEIWNETANQNHQLIRLLKVKREDDETVFDFWNKFTRLAADCGLENKTAPDIISALIVAVFTISVNDEDIVKAVWEKSLKHDELSQHIVKVHKTSQILSQVTVEKLKVKQEPIGRIKQRQHSDEPRKKGTCIRCGEMWTKSHMEKCPAKKNLQHLQERRAHRKRLQVV